MTRSTLRQAPTSRARAGRTEARISRNQKALFQRAAELSGPDAHGFRRLQRPRSSTKVGGNSLPRRKTGSLGDKDPSVRWQIKATDTKTGRDPVIRLKAVVQSASQFRC
jgi:hypothetical protein